MRSWWMVGAVACGGGAASHVDARLGDGPVDTPVDAPADAGLVVTMGSGDPAFGSDGVRSYDFGGIDMPGAAVVLPSGRLLVPVYTVPVGSASGSGQLLAFTSDGAIDTSFGSGGSVPLAQGGDLLGALANDSVIVETGLGVFEHRLADGSLDSTYGGSGHANATFDLGITPVTLQNTTLIPAAMDASGRVYVAAWQSDGHTLVSRLTATGRTDSTFGPYGTVQAGLGLPLMVVAEADGSLWMAVSHDLHALEFRHVLENGTVDPQVDGFLDNVDTRICGAIIAAGGGFTVAGSFQRAARTYLARFLPTGAPDTSYHGGLLDAAAGQCFAVGNNVAARANGGIIAQAASGMPLRAGVFAVDGTGNHETAYAAAAFGWTSLFELPDGKLLAVGRSSITQTAADDVVIARYLP